jgi:hypothetical protein
LLALETDSLKHPSPSYNVDAKCPNLAEPKSEPTSIPFCRNTGVFVGKQRPWRKGAEGRARARARARVGLPCGPALNFNIAY